MQISWYFKILKTDNGIGYVKRTDKSNSKIFIHLKTFINYELLVSLYKK